MRTLPPAPLSTADTVARDTPARRATSTLVALRILVIALPHETQCDDSCHHSNHVNSIHPFLRRLIFVAQPLPHGVALDDVTRAAFAAWPTRPPIVVDESDGAIGSLPRALAYGYAGTSHKNCKGVIKGPLTLPCSPPTAAPTPPGPISRAAKTLPAWAPWPCCKTSRSWRASVSRTSSATDITTFGGW